MPQEIIITVKSDGTIKCAFEGFEGECCFQTADQLNKALEKYGIQLTLAEPVICQLPQAPLVPRQEVEIKGK